MLMGSLTNINDINLNQCECMNFLHEKVIDYCPFILTLDFHSLHLIP